MPFEIDPRQKNENIREPHYQWPCTFFLTMSICCSDFAIRNSCLSEKVWATSADLVLAMSPCSISISSRLTNVVSITDFIKRTSSVRWVRHTLDMVTPSTSLNPRHNCVFSVSATLPIVVSRVDLAAINQLTEPDLNPPR